MRQGAGPLSHMPRNEDEHMWYQREHDACGIGTIVNIDGRKDHRVLDDALHIVEKLEHRAGKDATGEVGDGVGILTQISHRFFKEAAQEAGIATASACSSCRRTP